MNPIYGSVGLLWSGNWQLCQDAVEAVMKGEPITEIATDAATIGQSPPLKIYDIRHNTKEDHSAAAAATGSIELKRAKTRRVKRVFTVAKQSGSEEKSGGGEASHESSLSHQSEIMAAHEGESKESESNVSEVLAFSPPAVQGSGEIQLDLTLGLEPVSHAYHVVPVKKRRIGVFGTCQKESTCKTELML